MPNYDYMCDPDIGGCGYRYEQFFSIADRLKETKTKCIVCKKKKIVLAPSAPGFGDPLKLGVTKLPTSWTDKLKEMKGRHRGSTINTERSSRR